MVSIICPIGHCDPYNDYNGMENNSSDYQCLGNWKGWSYGECSITDNYSIKYGTTVFLPHHDCLKMPFAVSLLLLVFISFLYWCLVIAFIFFLLHFQFDVTAGYAYSVIFFYSVLEHLVGMFSTYKYDLDLHMPVFLLFLTIIGTLRPPFLQYLTICLGNRSCDASLHSSSNSFICGSIDLYHI